MKEMMRNFQSPGSHFRGVPFWAWNAELDEEELVRQIGIFKKMGFGGFFMHARVGLNTAYLSRKWFDCIKRSVAEAKKLGMEANLYDEDRWPSGAAGSLVTRDDRYKMHFCIAEFFDRTEDAEAAEKNGQTLAWFDVKVSGQGTERKVRSPQRLDSPKSFKPAKGHKLLRFADVLSPKFSWFNGETYLDTMNPEAVQKFIEVTHEAYYREIGSEFGKTVPAIFTDEPNFTHCAHLYYQIQWTPALPEKYREKYGRDACDELPEIFFPSVRKISAARMRFYDLSAELFVQAFSRGIGEWCGRHNIAMTGHVLLEDNLLQTLEVGSAMRFYEYMQMPGIDLLTEHWGIFNTVKQCTSMAHQFGHKWRLSETYGCTGWDFPFMGHKALGDWQYALGINFRCQHLAWYSAEAEAKRDYPASISYQSSWYGKYPVVEDYFGRLGAVLSEGEEVRDLLVIHPIESAWMEIDPCDLAKTLKAANHRFASLTNRLLEQKLDFDFGEEEVISRHGRTEGCLFRINRAGYKAVLIPELRTIRATTLELLRQFAENGGTVLYLGSAPVYLDGELSSLPAEIFAKFRKTVFADAVKFLAPLVRRVSVCLPDGKQAAPVLTRLADTGAAFTVFLCNYGVRFSDNIFENCLVRDRKLRFPRATIDLNIPERGNVYELNPADGSIYEVPAVYADGHYRFTTSFEPLASRLYLVTPERPEGVQPRPERTQPSRSRKLPSDGWSYTLNEPNVLVLDHADWQVKNGESGKDEFILTLDDNLRKLLGKEPRGGAMVQPWLRKQTAPEKVLDLELTYHINVEELPETDCLLAVERPEFYTFELNGKPLEIKIERWWCDRALQCLKIPSERLHQGDNRLILRGKYHENLPGLESMFLLGDFGVRNDTLVQQPDTLAVGDWTQQGFPYYAADITYSREIEVPENGAELEFPEWRGVLIGVRINGNKEQLLPWPPFRLKLSAGKIRLEITVYGSRRNAMGPFYCETPWPTWTGPDQFKDRTSKTRQLVPCGLLKPPVLRFR